MHNSTTALDLQHPEVRHDGPQARPSKEQLAQELEDARLLQQLSTELIQEDGTEGLYKKIVEAAVAIMDSQYASMQMLYPEKGTIGKLHLLATSGFSPEAEKFWEWVYMSTASPCGAALRAQRRVVIPDFRTCEFMQGESNQTIILEAGILSAQSTPLFSRAGRLVGMITTHWDRPHNPSEQHLRLFDVLARQAADLIERTQTAEALRQSEEKLRALATATNDVIFRTSPGWERMYKHDGTHCLDEVGAPVRNWMEKYVHPDDRQMVSEIIAHAIETKGVLQVEHRRLRKDGSIGWIFSRAVPIVDQDQNITEWIGASSDITEKKELMTILEQKVDDRTRKLHRSNEDLQQFAHVASHDLKEPVRKIRTFGLRLRNELVSNGDQKLLLYTDKILKSASRMSTMIEGVLTYSYLNALNNEHTMLDLNNIINDIQRDLEILIQQKGALVQCESLPTVEGIEVLVYQLFYNLIYNSLKFSRSGVPPRITIKAVETEIDGIPHARISVADNGIGFNPEYNEDIFKTFARLHSKDQYDGTGLGLALAKKVAERHHGTISAEGEEGKGAVFTIEMPVRQG